MFQGSEKATGLVDQLIGRANAAAVAALNEGAQALFEAAQKEVPKSQHHEPRHGDPGYPAESLAERAFVQEATLGNLQAHVVYPGPYAAAQELGRMQYQRNDKEVEWEVTHYTTDGTKSHYLEDAGKAVLGGMEEEFAIQGHIAFGDLPGFHQTPQTMTQAGRREEATMEPAGEIGQILSREQSRITNLPPSSLTEVPGGHPPILQ